MTSAARKRLEALAREPDERIDLAEAALAIAAEEYPGLDSAAYRARLDALAAAAHDRIPPGLPAAEAIARLNAFLFVECGFAGDGEDYYDPRNSFLNEVLDRRRGIPISLSLVYAEVARRLGLAVTGVSFPGHFLLKHVGEPEIFIDAFTGAVLTRADCERRFHTLYGDDTPFDPRTLVPARPREILVRWLRNLKQIYLQRGDLARALKAVDRILLFAPDLADDVRDRGALYLKLECFAAALADFERYLELAPAGDGVAEVRSALPDLRRQVARLQ